MTRIAGRGADTIVRLTIVMYVNIILSMIYFIEVPFGKVDDDDAQPERRRELRAEGWSEDLVCLRGVLALRISGRQFERTTKVFRERGVSHKLTGLADVEDDDGKVSGTLLSTPGADIPGLIFMPKREA